MRNFKIKSIKQMFVFLFVFVLGCFALSFSVNTAAASEYENFNNASDDCFNESSPNDRYSINLNLFDLKFSVPKGIEMDRNLNFTIPWNTHFVDDIEYTTDSFIGDDFEVVKAKEVSTEDRSGSIMLRHLSQVIHSHYYRANCVGEDIHVSHLEQVSAEELIASVIVDSHAVCLSEPGYGRPDKEVNERDYKVPIYFSEPVVVDDSLLNKNIDINISNQDELENIIKIKPMTGDVLYSFNNENTDWGYFRYNGAEFSNKSVECYKKPFNYSIDKVSDSQSNINIEYIDGTSDVIEVISKPNFIIESLKVNGSEESSGLFDSSWRIVFDTSFKHEPVGIHYYAYVENEWLPIYDLHEPTGSLYYSCNYVVKQNSVWQGVSYTINYYDSSVDISNPANYRYVDPIAVMEINPGQVLDRTGFDCIGFSADDGCFLPYTDDDGEYLATDTEGNFIGKVGAGGNVYLTFGKSSYGTSQNTILDCFMRCFNNQQNESDRAPYGMEYRLEKIGARSFIVKN